MHSCLCQAEDGCEKFSCICSCPKSPSLSTWGALCYFDVTVTVKTEQELVIHIATCNNNLSNKLTSALYYPASCVPNRTPTTESSKLTRRSVEGGKLAIQKPCCTPFRPWQSGSSVHTWCSRNRMDFGLCPPIQSPIFYPMLWSAGFPPSTADMKRETERLAGQAKAQPSQHWIAQTYSFGWRKFRFSPPSPASLYLRSWTVQACNEPCNWIL